LAAADDREDLAHDGIGTGVPALSAAVAREFHRAHLAKLAANTISTADLTEELQRLPAEDLHRVQRMLQVRAGAPAAVVAQSMQTTLAREPEPVVVRALHGGLLAGVACTALTAELSGSDLAALLAADRSGLGFLATARLRGPLLDITLFGVSASVRAAAWAAMVSGEHPGGVAALAWLVADPPSGWSEAVRQLLADGWRQVQRRLPALPERPASLGRLAGVVAELDREGVFEPGGEKPDEVKEKPEEVKPGDENEVPAALVDQHGTGHRHSMDISSGVIDASAPEDQLADLFERCESIADMLGEIRRHDLPAVAQALESGAAPPGAEFGRVSSYGDAVKELFHAVAGVTGAPAPATLDEARLRLDEMRADSLSVAVLGRIRRLVDLRVPEYVAAEAAQASELATGAGADTDPSILAGLDALVKAIEIGAGDPQRSAEQARIVATALPQLSLLVTLAAQGLVACPGDRSEAGSPAGSPAVEAPDETAGGGAVSLDDVLAGLALTVPGPESAPPAATTATGPDLSSAPAAGDRPGPVASGPADDAIADRHYEALLGDQQYALASWLLTALDRPAPVIAVHRLAAHAAAMRTSAGPNATAFADTLRQVAADTLRDRLDLQMLVYAASVRAGLLSPTAGAAGPLRDLTARVVKCGPAVEELTEAVLTTIYNGAYLTPRSADAVAEAAEAEAAHDALADAARELLHSAPHRTIRYQAATELWQAWTAPGGYLGAPLAVVAEGSRDPEKVDFVRRRIRDLRSRSSLEATLDQDTRRAAPARRGRRIEARSREKILNWTGDVTDMLARWVAATEALTRPGTGTWMADPMAELRTRVNAVRSQALDQLMSRATSGNRARDAGFAAGMTLLRESLEILDGAVTLGGPEIPADRLLGSLLALAPELPLTAELIPARGITVADISGIVEALRLGHDGWTAAFERRAARHDQVGTQVLIDALRPTDPHLAQRLSAARDRAVAESTAQLDTRAGGLTSQIDSDRRFGRMTEEQWADLATRARSYLAAVRGPRRDFDRMLGDIARLEQERAEIVQAAVRAVQGRLGEAGLGEEVRARIASRISDGDLTTANEYLETARSGRDLPAPRDDSEHIRLFCPAFPALFARSVASLRTSPLVELRRAIDESRNPASGRLAGALAASQIDLTRIGRPKTASSRIGQWTTLAESKVLDAGKLRNVKAVLEQLGFLVDTADTPSPRRGQTNGRSSWMHLTGVRATAGRALIPAFGSAISPSGDTVRVLAVWRSPTPQELVELLRNEPTDHSVIVLYFGVLDDTARRELANEFRRGRKLPVSAVVDEAAYAYLVAQPEPGRDITMAITLPFTSATPFTPDVAGLVPQEMFYGRAEERDKVVDMMGSCIVYGGRQLGKSALLRAAAREFDDGRTRHAIYQSIYKVGQANPVDAVWTTLWPPLADKGIVSRDIPSGDVATALTRQVTTWIAGRSGRQLLLLLDESDSFLDADATDGRFTQVTHVKELMERTGRAVKVVFAGLHQTARFERLANHPLAHFGDPVCVGPLAPQPAYDLLSRPLQALGFEFENHDHASRVLALANNQPALIQLFGAQLLRNLQRTRLPGQAPPQTVTGEDVEAVWADDSLRGSFRKRFDWTLNLDPRYKVIAYSVAFHAHANGAAAALTPAALRSECEQWWPKGFAAEDVRTGEFRALLDECVDLGVLSYANGAYRLRTPNVLDLLGARDEVDEFLEQADSTPLPESFDGSLMRPAFGSSATRGPLTSQQIADLLAQRSQVRLIAGSAALTVERCLRTLQDENEKGASGGRRSHLREAGATALRATCQQATMRAAGGHAVVIADLTAAPFDTALDAWRTARELIAAHSGGTVGIVLVTSPAQAPLWLIAGEESDASSGVTGLRRYDRTDLRLWLADTTLPFQDDASRGELLAVTGGWPVNVNRVVEDLLREEDPDSRGDPLGRLRTYLADPAHADAFVVAAGARCDDAVREAWRFLVAEVGSDRADAETFAEYLALHGESGAPGAAALGEHRLTETGYRNTTGVVEVLRTLGLLITDAEDGHLYAEPVLAAATRTVRG
jgi:hypothetical protein